MEKDIDDDARKRNATPTMREGAWQRKIAGLYRKGGMLYGKKYITYPFSAIDGQHFLLKKDSNEKDEAGMLALIHEIGWPDQDQIHHHHVNAVYHSLKLAVVFQHMDRESLQRRADDRSFDFWYASAGYYVIRVRCADRENDGWVSVDAAEIARRVRQLPELVLRLKRLNIERLGDLSGKVVIHPPSDSDEPLSIEDDTQSQSMYEKSLRRGSIRALELAAESIRAIIADQEAYFAARHQRHECRDPFDASPLLLSRESDLKGTLRMIERVLRTDEQQPLFSQPPVKDARFDIGSLVKNALNISDGIEGEQRQRQTEYERKWEARMNSYSPKAQYDERARKITLEIAEFSQRNNKRGGTNRITSSSPFS